ncbi:MAG: DUF3343 domain-containing protein [Clostridiales bacterium]|jgi:hypothetical protein|nr:DUF3343 domain-containing protein [Clostridiales bacterium]MDD2572722.1 DUF3343 domain-containing protein [Eubacteriales bacterium]MDD4187133.1 DUF3343 domain-containing protein [Eubacteriales bacterium]MDY0120003.1 DUF3343 domain-containing protein [Clostridia bacterium]
MKESVFISFFSTNAAIRAEQTLLSQGYDVVVQPTPPAIKAGCGISLLVLQKDWEKIKQILDQMNIEILVTPG